jgi:hypothetical protein
MFSRAAKAAPWPARPKPPVAQPTPLGSVWLSSPREVRALIVAAVVIAALILLLGLIERLGAPGQQRSATGDPQRLGPNRRTRDQPRPTPPEPKRGDIVVRSHEAGDNDEGVDPVGTLMEGVRAAMERRSGYVELKNSTPLKLGASDLIDNSSARGTLDIRAAGGTQPVIEVLMDPSHPFLETGSAVELKLTGVTIRGRYEAPAGAMPAAWPALIHAHRSIQVDHCAFEVVGTRPVGGRALMVDGGNVSVARCRFEGFDEAIRAKVYGGTGIEIRQTMILAERGAAPTASPVPRGWALGVELVPGSGPSGGSKRHLLLDHCTIEGAGLLDLTSGEGQSSLAADVNYCDMRVDALLAWQPRKREDRLEVDLRWQGLGNRFQIRGGFWVVQSARTMTPASTLDVTDLKSWSRFVVREAEAAGSAGADPQQTGPSGQ